MLFAAAFVVVAATAAAHAAPAVKTRLVTLPGPRAMVSASPGISAAVMTDDNGLTLYTSTRDTVGATKTNCTGQCAINWPPFIAAAGAIADADWTIVDGTDKDGTTAIKQWAYMGMPVYYYVGDTAPGLATGEFAGDDIWHVIKMKYVPPPRIANPAG
jgi:predicted lipoprotein with Yx(FWY)xxD motif